MRSNCLQSFYPCLSFPMPLKPYDINSFELPLFLSYQFPIKHPSSGVLGFPIPAVPQLMISLRCAPVFGRDMSLILTARWPSPLSRSSHEGIEALTTQLPTYRISFVTCLIGSNPRLFRNVSEQDIWKWPSNYSRRASALCEEVVCFE